MFFSNPWTSAAPTGLLFSKPWKFIFLALCSTALAQDDGTEISGFRVPDYDENGVMTSQLFGDHALVGKGEVKITVVRMEFYKGGETNLVVTSPYCFFNQQTRVARSDAPVKAVMDGMQVSGRGFTLESVERKVHIREDSKVIIDDVMQEGAMDFGSALPELSAVAGAKTADTNDVTVITSEELFMDYSERKVRFERTVHVQDPQMSMDCARMFVKFDENNEIDWIEALEEVKLYSEGREAIAERAFYDAKTNEFMLEGHPRILEGKNMMMGERIRFWRATGRMVCEPSARLIIYSDEKQDTNILGK